MSGNKFSKEKHIWQYWTTLTRQERGRDYYSLLRFYFVGLVLIFLRVYRKNMILVINFLILK